MSDRDRERAWSSAHQFDEELLVEGRQVKTFPSHCIGYRAFLADREGNLRSAGLGETTWRPGTNVAYCKEHTAPQPGCSCGLYFCFSPYGLSRSNQYVYAVCACRGETMVHGVGFRSEEAEILCLAIPNCLLDRELGGRELSEEDRLALERARAASQRFGVPLVGLADLERVGQSYGSAPERPRYPGRPNTRVEDQQTVLMMPPLLAAVSTVIAVLVLLMAIVLGLGHGWVEVAAAIAFGWLALCGLIFQAAIHMLTGEVFGGPLGWSGIARRGQVLLAATLLLLPVELALLAGFFLGAIWAPVAAGVCALFTAIGLRAGITGARMRERINQRSFAG